MNAADILYRVLFNFAVLSALIYFNVLPLDNATIVGWWIGSAIGIGIIYALKSSTTKEK